MLRHTLLKVFIQIYRIIKMFKSMYLINLVYNIYKFNSIYGKFILF